MDINSLLSTVLSDDSVGSVSKASALSNEQTRSILSSALPMLLGGALNQSNNASTASGFAGALNQHSAADTGNLSAFFKNVDTEDGAKIVQHLLGANSAAVTDQIAANSGVRSADVSKTLAAIAPLLMSLLGKEAMKQQSGGAGNIMGTLLGGANSTKLLMSMLGGGKDAGSGNALAGILGAFLK